MFYTQRKALKLNHEMEKFILQSNNDLDYKMPVPRQYINDYKEAISIYSLIYQPLINAFHAQYCNPPFSYIDFLEFIKERFGLGCTIYGFNKNNFEELEVDLNNNTKGTWCWDNEEKSEFSIWVNTDYPKNIQNVTIIHEVVHAIQDFDYNFHEILRGYPIPIQLKIAEQIAEKTAIAVVIPTMMLEEDKDKGLRPHQIALKYKILLQMAGYAG